MTKKNRIIAALFAACLWCWPFALLGASAVFINANGTQQTNWQLGGSLGPQIKGSGGSVQVRNATDTGFATLQVAAPSGANDVATKSYTDSVAGAGPGMFYVTAYGATGNGTTDDTASVQSAEAAAEAYGGGTVVVPNPPGTYLLSGPITVNHSGIVFAGLNGMGSIYHPTFTQSTYGQPIFDVYTSDVSIRDLSGQYGPQTKLANSASIGATTVSVLSAASLTVNDWLIFDQPIGANPVAVSGAPDIYPMEMLQISGISGNTITLSGSLANAHASGSWVRDQFAVPGASIAAQPPRNRAGFAAFITGNECSVERAGVIGMVTGVYFRGEPSSNNANDFNNRVSDLNTSWVQYAVLAQQQTGFRINRETYGRSTRGQTTAPGHGIYMTGLAALSGAWSSGTTYAQYAQISFSGIQYISKSAGNIGHQPDTSPTFWSAQTYPSSTTGWRARNYDLTIDGVYAAPFDGAKDWSGVKVKWTDGAVISNVLVEDAVRGFDLQECNNCTLTNFSIRNFVPPDSADTGAAGVTLLDCNGTSVSSGTINLSQDSRQGNASGVIDMPAILNRTDGTLDPFLGVQQGHDNTFVGLTTFSLVDSSFTSAIYRTQGNNTQFIDCAETDAGGQNPAAFYFAANGTFGTFANNGTVVSPHVTGTTSIVQQSAGCTGNVASLDANLLPAGYTIGTGITRNDQPASLTLSPTSTTNDVISSLAPVSAAFKWINLKNSSGNTEVGADFRTANARWIIESSSAGGNGNMAVGLNAAGGYAASGASMGSYTFVDNSNTPGSWTGVYASASENHDVTHGGTDLLFKAVANGAITPTTYGRVYNNGDFSANATGSALATGATGGFFLLPNMAGWATGTPTGRTGGTDVAFDTTDGRLLTRNGGAWLDVGGLTVAASGPSNGTTFGCGSMVRVSSGQSGFSYTIPSAATCQGSRLMLKCTNAGSTYSYTLTPAAGTIDGAGSYTFTCVSEQATVEAIADTTNWQTITPHIDVTHSTGTLPLANIAQSGATTGQLMRWSGSAWAPATVTLPYQADSPAYHSLTEWNGAPEFFTAGNSMTSGTLYLTRIAAQTGGTISKIWLDVSTAGVGLTAATTTTVTGAANNGSGLIRLAVTASGSFATNDVLTIAGVVGTNEANATYLATVIDGTHIDLQGSTFTNAWVSGGVVTRSACAGVLFNSSGAIMAATGDQAAVWNTGGMYGMSLANTVSVVSGSTYYEGFMFAGTSLSIEGAASGSMANVNLANAASRWATNGTGLTKLPSSITPASNGVTNLKTFWAGLN